MLKSVDIINNILDVCRGVKGDHYIRISDSDIFSHNLTYLNAESQEVPGGAFAIGGQLEIGTGGAYEPSQQEVSKIKNILAIDARLPLWQTLLFDAYDHHFYRNYRIAIVEAGTAFEVFIYNFIGKGYHRLGKTKQEIENKLQAPFKNLICDHIQILTGFDFCNSTEYENWDNHAYKVRNRIVHRGGKTTDIESSKAVTTVGNTIKFLISLNYL